MVESGGVGVSVCGGEGGGVGGWLVKVAGYCVAWGNAAARQGELP